MVITLLGRPKSREKGPECKKQKSFVCNGCGRVESAKAAKDWRQLKHAGAVYHFCGDPCLQRWSAALPRQLELPALSAEPVRIHEPRAAYGHQREEP